MTPIIVFSLLFGSVSAWSAIHMKTGTLDHGFISSSQKCYVVLRDLEHDWHHLQFHLNGSDSDVLIDDSTV
jgi:hypothetical protein